MCGGTTWMLLDGHSTLQALEGGLAIKVASGMYFGPARARARGSGVLMRCVRLHPLASDGQSRTSGLAKRGVRRRTRPAPGPIYGSKSEI